MPPASPDFRLRPDVMREQDPTPARLIFWLQGARHGSVRDWRRVCSTPPFTIIEHDGFCCTAASLTPFREKSVGMLSRLFGLSGGDANAVRYMLPTGGQAEASGAARGDVLLVWSGQGDAPLDEARIAEQWPEHQGCEQLGEHLYLVLGAQPPAAKPPVAESSPRTPPAESFAAAWSNSTPPTSENGFNAPVVSETPPAPPPIPSPSPTSAAGNFTLNLSAYPGGEPAASPPTAPLQPQDAPSLQHTRGPQEQMDELNEQIEQLCEDGEFAQAVEPAGRAAQLAHALHGDNHPEFAVSLMTLAEVFCAAGQYNKAEPVVRQTAQLWRQLGGESHPEFLRSLNLLSSIFVLTGRPGDGLQQLLQVALAGDRTVEAVRAATSEDLRLLHLETLQEDVDRLLTLAAQAFAASPQAACAALDLVLRRKAIGVEAMAIRRDVVLSRRYPQLKSAFDELNVIRGQMAWRLLAGPGSEGVGELQQALAQWQAKRMSLEQQLSAQVPELAQELAANRADRAAVAAALPPDSAFIEYVRYNSCDFRAASGRTETEWGEPRYLAIVLQAGTPDACRLVSLGEAERIDALVAAFRDQLRDGTSTEGEQDPGAALRRAIFDPIAGRIGKRTRLVLAPDGALCRLPFEVLPLDDGRRLIDAYLVSYLGVGRDVVRLAFRSQETPSVAVVAADANYDFGHDYPPLESDEKPTWRHAHAMEVEKLEFAPQPDSRIEAARSAALLGVRPWLGETVLESRMKSLRSPRILHLAVQSFFLPEQNLDELLDDEIEEDEEDGDEAEEVEIEVGMPFLESPLLRGGLALAGANGVGKGYQPPPEAQDGILTAEEVSGLDLLETELVVLSGVDAGSGDAEVGSAVLALRRAFTLAGARTLVLSLWRAPGLVTAVLLERFYENLLTKKLGRAEALREAQVYLREVSLGELRPRWLTEAVRRQAAGHEPTLKYLQMLTEQPDDVRPFRHPRYWGAFICHGDWNPLP